MASPDCGVRAEVNVMAEPLNVYSTFGTSRSPLRYNRKLVVGFGDDANVKLTFAPLIVPPGISASVKFVVEPVPAMR